MSIDTTKPIYPQDHPLDEVIALQTKDSGMFFTIDKRLELVSRIKEDHYLRTNGPAAIFLDIRRKVENALHGQSMQQMLPRDYPQPREELDASGCISVNVERFMGTLDEVITSAICNLTSTSHDAPFFISDYAIPVFGEETDACGTRLIEDSRPCTEVLQKYWAAVSTEKSTS